MLSPRHLAYLGASFSVGGFSAFNNFSLSLWLTGFTSSYVLISLLGNTRSFEGAIVSPLTGAWSDRLWLGWLGRRRPFILVGGLLSALLLALTPAISRLALPAWLPPEVVRLGAPLMLAPGETPADFTTRLQRACYALARQAEAALDGAAAAPGPAETRAPTEVG
jgi:hypothetical protein